MEAEFNYNDKVLVQKVMKRAEENNLILREKCGSRKGHRDVTRAIEQKIVAQS